MKVLALIAFLLAACFVSESEQVLNVHVVSHTHDDVGWLKTPDEYYYGDLTNIQNAGVQYIIDTTISELAANPDRKFMYVEMAFFTRWWREQTPETQAVVKGLVNNGQLEFINGGWTMHDEACVHFEDMVSQMTLGHQFIFDTFGVVPKVGWEIDPFGHSATNAYLDNLMGFEALFYARMDYQDLANRQTFRGVEMNWYPSQSNPDIELLTGMMSLSYCTGGFNWEYGDEPVMDDPLLENFNLPERAQALQQIAFQLASYVRHNDVMIPFGCDFQYQNAHMNFKNIEKLMKYVNNNTALYNMTLQYSNPRIYADAIKTANPTLPNKYGDFMPYADCPHCYWSGYFVSRSAYKGMVRYSSNLLSAVTALLSSSQIQSDDLMEQLFMVQGPNGVATHHDSVTGTEKQHVVDDYALNLDEANTAAFGIINQVLGQLSGNKNAPQFSFCRLLNESTCDATTSWSTGVLPVVLYNPLAWDRTENVRIPLSTAKVSVTDSNGNAVPAQVSPGDNGQFNLTFTVSVPALGFNTYFVQQATSSPAQYVEPAAAPSGGFTVENAHLHVQFDASGNIQIVTNKATGAVTNVQQEYLYYAGNPGDSVSGQASGAYIFRPVTQAASAFPYTPTVSILNGSVVIEVVRVFSASLSQVFRLYANAEYLEIEDIIGPIDISDGKGKEVITRYTTGFASNGTWYSDSNGIEMIERILNFRPDWTYQVTEPVAGNYVPVDAITYIKDQTANQQLTVLTDRSRSSASLANGQLETMLHRRLLVDDGRGVGEPLNETTVINTRELLVFSNASSAASYFRPLAKRHYHPLLPAFSSAASVQAWTSANKVSWAPFTSLPENVQLLSFVPIASGYIVRLHHIFQVGEDAVLSQPATVDLATLFPGLTVASVQETQLTAVEAVSRQDAVRYDLKSGAPQAVPVTLNATDIRTFVVKFSTTAAAPHVSIVN